MMIWYGFDPDAPVVQELDELSQVLVDDIDINPIPRVDNIDTLRQSDSMGIDIYCNVLSLVNGTLY